MSGAIMTVIIAASVSCPWLTLWGSYPDMGACKLAKPEVTLQLAEQTCVVKLIVCNPVKERL